MLDFDNVKKKLAENVKKARENKKISQSALANAKSVDMAQSTISQIENAVANPSLGAIVEIAKELDVTLAWLLGLAEDSYEKTSDMSMFNLFIDILENSDGKWKIATNVGTDEEDEERVKFFNKKGEVAICSNDTRFRDFVREYWDIIRLGNDIAEKHPRGEEYAEEIRKSFINEFREKLMQN